MNLKDWLEMEGISMHALGKLSGLTAGTIKNICRGKPPTIRTVKRLIRVTKNFPNPITYRMFKEVYQGGLYRYVGIEEAIRSLK